MAVKLFTDQQKQALATEAGYKGPFDTNMFNRDDNVQTGESTMYMKLGNNQKFYGANPMKAQMTANPIASQAENMKSQFGAQPLDAAYNAYLKAIPSSKQTYYDEIGMSTGIYSEMQSIAQQQMKMLQAMTGDQSAIFSATNPDGTPVDPRIKVAQYKANMQSVTERVEQLRQLETVYKSQLKVLGDAEFDKAQKQAETAKTALLYLKDMNDQANRDRDAQFRDKELAQRSSQFERELSQKAYQFNEENNFRYSGGGAKPELVQDAQGNYKWILPPVPGIGGPSGQITSKTFSSASQKNKNVQLDSSAMTGFEKSMDMMNQQGVDIVIGSTTRSTEEQAKLRAAYEAGAGGIAAKPGESKHEKGLAIDIYSDSKFSAPTRAQIDAMEANGWKHMAIPGDLGHFEYQGSNNEMIKTTGIIGPTKEPSYEDKLISVGKELESLEIVSMKDANELIDAMSKQYPSKKREDIVLGLYNASPERMKIAIDAIGISRQLNDFTPETVKSTLNQLAGQYESIESVHKAFTDAGFFKKYTDDVWDSEQLDAAQKWFDDNGYDLTDGKIKKN